MPPLVCLSPALLDQSFPRAISEAHRVAIALGKIQELLEENTIHLVATNTLAEFVELFEWDRPDLSENYPILQSIHDLLVQWFLHPDESVIKITTLSVTNFSPHPIPTGTTDQGLVEDWSIEAGKLFSIHKAIVGNNYFIGVACDFAFSGEAKGSYDISTQTEFFPLIGPDELATLIDGYDWDYPADIHTQNISINDFQRNFKYIGAISISPPSGQGGSHCPVHFTNALRPWPLDLHYDPIPLYHLNTLSRTVNLPVNVLRDCLINGKYPNKKCKLHNHQV